MPNICQYGKHEVEQHYATLYNYRDVSNGITEDVRICNQCLVDHLRKHYPDSPIIPHVMKTDPEVK